MKTLPKYVVTLVLLTVALQVRAAPALVDSAWLAANLERPDLVVLDIQDPKTYRRYHVPGAVNAEYAKWRTSGKGEPRSMLPPVERMEALIGGLGIDNEKLVVIVATGRGAGDLAAAARVFWTFKVLGHDRVSVLDGGLMAYARAKNALEKGANDPRPATFTASPDPDMALGADGVRSLLEQRGQFVDARSAGEYVGLYRGDEAERPGTIPGAMSLPYDWVTAEGSATLRSAGALQELFGARGISTEGDQVHFCHSGNRAALTWFAAYAVLGNEKARLYDGSMMEWARRADLPVDQKIELCDAC